jgi:hypothetical protein
MLPKQALFILLLGSVVVVATDVITYRRPERFRCEQSDKNTTPGRIPDEGCTVHSYLTPTDEQSPCDPKFGAPGSGGSITFHDHSNMHKELYVDVETDIDDKASQAQLSIGGGKCTADGSRGLACAAGADATVLGRLQNQLKQVEDNVDGNDERNMELTAKLSQTVAGL